MGRHYLHSLEKCLIPDSSRYDWIVQTGALAAAAGVAVFAAPVTALAGLWDVLWDVTVEVTGGLA